MGSDASGASANANVTNSQITPTRSIFVMQAGPMNMTITFLSPVEVRGSILFTNDITLRTLALSARRLGQAVDSIFVPFCRSPIA